MLALVGWATYKFAPRVGPNPIFGVRTGYSMVNRAVWDHTNRVGGLALAGIGALVGAVAAALDVATPWTETVLVSIVAGVLVAAMIAMLVWLVLYSRKLAQGITPASARPIEVALAWLAPSAVVASLSIIFILVTASELPADRVAPHFAFDGAANGWMSRTGYLAAMVILVVGMLALTAGIFYLVSHVSIPGADDWPVSGEAVMKFFAAIMAGMQVLMAVVFWDIYWFNTRGEHPFPIAAFTIGTIVVTLVAVPAAIAWLVLRSRARS